MEYLNMRWRAAKLAWQTYKFAIRHELAHQKWERVAKMAMDYRINEIIEASKGAHYDELN